jgi:hypothetical protein
MVWKYSGDRVLVDTRDASQIINLDAIISGLIHSGFHLYSFIAVEWHQDGTLIVKEWNEKYTEKTIEIFLSLKKFSLREVKQIIQDLEWGFRDAPEEAFRTPEMKVAGIHRWCVSTGA